MKRYSTKIGVLGMVSCAVILFVLIPFMSVKIDKLLGLTINRTKLAILSGTIFFLLGGIVALWCIILFFLIGRGTTFPLSPPQKLVVRGPYKYSRNPMVLGMWLMLFGEALILVSVTLLFFTIFVAIPGGVLFVTKYEEPDLEHRFGTEYLEYKKTVPRWIPKLR